MPAHAATREPPSSRPGRDDYWALSTRPLQSFFFLAAFVAVYEVGTLLYLTDQREGIQHTVRARRLLDLFFQNFGVAGFMATGLAMLTVLLVMHILSREKWRVRPMIFAGMALEASLWSLPLVVFGAIFQRAAATLASAADAGAGLPVLLGAADAGQRLMELSWQARVTIAIGAGIYEEMLFRLVGIALIHFVVKDLLQARELTARCIAVAGTAAAFAAYHDVSGMARADQWAAMLFYGLAGVYFGVIYVTRGFGIVVATHAIYDILALVILAPVRA